MTSADVSRETIGQHMTKNHMPELSDFARIERVLLATGELRASDRARLAYRPEPEVDRENGIHIATRQDDEGTFERQAKGDLYTEESDTIRHKRSRLESPLDRYYRRSELDARSGKANYRLWKAGHTLRIDWRGTKMTRRITSDLLQVGGGGGNREEISDMASDAFGRYKSALAKVGPVLAPVLVHVVCMEGTAQEWGMGQGLRGQRAEIGGVVALRLALDYLAIHYGLE